MRDLPSAKRGDDRLPVRVVEGSCLHQLAASSGGAEQSNLLEQRGRQLAVDSPIGQGDGSGSGGLVEGDGEARRGGVV